MKNEIDFYKQHSIVKFIFLDECFKEYSFDSSIREMRSFRSKFPANSFVIVPLVISRCGEEGTLVTLSVTEDKGKANGYAMISKQDIHDYYKEVRYERKNERVDFGRKVCLEEIIAYNKLINESNNGK